MGPNYSNYSFDELKQVLSGIHKSKHPERVREILFYLEKRKPDDIRILETRYGYRFLHEDQIPKSIPEHVVKSFSYRSGDPKHIKRQIILLLSLLPLYVGVLHQLQWLGTRLGEISVVLFVAYHISHLAKAIHANRLHRIRFFDDRIEHTTGSHTDAYALIELTGITLHRGQPTPSGYVQSITLDFQGDRSFSIHPGESYYDSAAPYLDTYLKQRVNTSRFS